MYIYIIYIYIYIYIQCAIAMCQLSSKWLYCNSCTWAHDVGGGIVFMITFILHPSCFGRF